MSPTRHTRTLAVTTVVVVAVMVVGAVLVLSRLSAEPTPTPKSQLDRETRLTGELYVSRDFGKTELVRREVALSDSETVMSLLSRNADVETAYGGGFVNSIEGLSSGFTKTAAVQADWFYYVNGMQADRGAIDYLVSRDDSVWWDFHRWDFATSVPAVIGQYPQPFLNAEEEGLDVTIVHVGSCKGAAESVASALRRDGVSSVRVVARGAGSVQPAQNGHTILVGPWTDLVTDAALTPAVDEPAASGVFATASVTSVTALDQRGEARTLDGPGGVVLATRGLSKARTVQWIVSGSTKGDVEAASGLFRNGGRALRGRFGVVVLRDGSVVSLPVTP